MSETKPAIVLVHGAWGGAWIWRRVVGPLREAGHEVHAVTLTGDGERAHLRQALGPGGITLAMHAADVLGLIAAEELRRPLLVGHSYGGAVITCVADALATAAKAAGVPAEQAAEAVHALVYVDAMVPMPGETWSSHHPPQIVSDRLALAERHGGALPPPDPWIFGLTEADQAWLARRHVPHPFGMYREPIDFDGARWAQMPRWFIDCHHPAYPTIDRMRLRVREQPGWHVQGMATGHFPMLSRPQELVEHLLAAAQ